MTSKTFKPGTVIDSAWLNDVNVAVYTTLPNLTSTIAASITKTSVGLGNVDNTSDVNKPVSTATQTALNAKQDTSGKDASGGYAGLTGYNINLKNATVTSQLVSAAAVARTYTFPDKSLIVAGTINETLINPTIMGYIEQFQTLNTGTAVTVNTANGTLIELTITANVTITLPAAVAGMCYTLIIKYGGAFTPTFSGGTSIKWAGGSVPTATATTGKMDKYVFTCGGTYTLGQDGGRNF